MFAVKEVSLFNVNIMKPSLFLAIICTFFTATLHAQTEQANIPEKDKAAPGSIEKLLRVTEVDLISESMVEHMKGVLDQNIKHTIDTEGLTDGDVPALENIRSQLQDWIEMEMTWDRLSPMYVQAYRDVFTQKEIDDLTEFFSSDTGRKFIKKQQDLQGLVNYMLQSNMKTFMDRFKSRYNVLIGDLIDNKAEKAESE
jgi:hypothetical protein